MELVLQSEAVMISNINPDSEKSDILSKLLFRIKAVRKARENKYILLNAPNDKIKEICEQLPGMKSPTIMPLVTEGWSSLHSVIREDDFWEVTQNLKNLGAEGILVVPIEKMIL